MKWRTFRRKNKAQSVGSFDASRRLTAILVGVFVVLGLVTPQTSLGKDADGAGSGSAESAELKTTDGRTRSYRVFIPSSYDGTTALPLLLVFHGGFGSGEQVARQTGFDEIAEREGFIAVYPDGATSDRREVVPTWNAGECCGYAMTADVDDVTFVSELIDSLESQFSIDSDRIYATGMSNGGMLSYRLACDLADRIAAVAPVAGSIPLGSCSPTRPIPLLIFHGTADENVPYDGGPVMRTGNIVPAASDLASTWASLDGCESEPITASEAGYSVIEYRGCAGGASVTLYSIDDFPHAWPGGDLAALHSGASSAIDASEVIWTFFKEQTL